MNPFAAFPAQPVSIEIAGETLSITPIRVGEVPALLATIQPFADQFADQLASAEPDWLAILSTHGTALLRTLALASRQSQDWIDALPLDAAIALATTLFEVNADFFVQRVKPAVQEASLRIHACLDPVPPGRTPSTASSMPATDSPTS
jgi:hypothetical protein